MRSDGAAKQYNRIYLGVISWSFNHIESEEMTRDDLIEYLMAHPPRPAISRAMNEGQPIEFFGGFSHIPPSNMPGWVISITTRFKKKFYVALRVHKIWKHQLFVEMLESVPWRYWDGDKSKSLLYKGDRPELYERLKRWQLKQKT